MRTIKLTGNQALHVYLNCHNLLYLACFITFLQACDPKENDSLSSNKTSVTAKKTSDNQSSNTKTYKRIVTIGDEVTETVIALGDSSKIVAIGRTCPKYPDFQRPKVGYELTLQTKFILDHKPDLVISSTEASPSAIVEEIREQKIDYLILEPIQDLPSVTGFILEIAEILQKKPQGEKIIKQISQKLNKVKDLKGTRKDTAKVMYVLVRGAGFMLMGGSATSFDAIIQLAGGKNVVTEIDGLQRVTEQDMIQLNPDFLLMSHQSYDSFKSKAYDMPILYASRAYRFGRVVMIDENRLRSPGVDIGETALELAKALYQQQYFAPLIPANPKPDVVTEKSEDLEIVPQNE